ncbi:hypothetical protein LBMAG56_28830 [Verrucomicrobiota bacterium]|nr:hypothetical protein LBMAG56_28830 [Verrucomicrobiota bacterium]
MSTGTVRQGQRPPASRVIKRKGRQSDKATSPTGGPAAATKPPPPKPKKPVPLPDYMARILKRQPKAMSAKATREFWEYERGDR